MNPLVQRAASAVKRFPLINRFRLRGTTLTAKNAVMLQCRFVCDGKDNTILCRDGALLRNCRFHIAGSRNVIEIGENTRIQNGEIYIEDDGNRVVIGDRTNMCGKIHIACTEGTAITIGNDCLFSSEIVLRSGDSHSLLDAVDGTRINPAADIEIADHVWIGHRVLINKGVKLLENTVVGTGAVVSKSPDQGGVVMAGVPAKIVKTNVNWCHERLSTQAQI